MNVTSAQSSEAFIESWLQARQNEDALDPGILALIEKHLGNDGLREKLLLNELVAYSRRVEGSDASN